MRLNFQETPWDLYASAVYTSVMAAVLLALGVGDLVAILLILFVPGYVLVAAFFPRSTEIDWIERIALSFGLSVAVVPLLGLILNFTPWGIRFAPIVSTITVFTLGVGCAAYWRRLHTPTNQRLSLTVELSLPDWRGYRALDKGLTVALAASIVVAGGTLAYVALTPRPGETFTEFYILGPGGNASDFPTKLNVYQNGSVILGVVNYEGTTLNYTIRIDLVGVRIIYNATSGINETVEVNRTTRSTFNVTLANGQNWTQPYTFQINSTGLRKVQFLLFKDGDFSFPYRELHLFVRIQ